MGDDMGIPLGTSIGAIFVPRFGNDYNALLKLADKSLYTVKKNGKHGCEIYNEDAFDEADNKELDIAAISEILGERSIQNAALQLDKEAFSHVYRYITRYALRHNINICKILFTINPAEGLTNGDYADMVDSFGSHIKESLRKSDIYMRNNKKQYFVLLTDIREDSYIKVADHIISSWEEKHKDTLKITYTTEFVRGNSKFYQLNSEKKVIVVDDDDINLQIATKILSSSGISVITLKSGEELLEYLEDDHHLPSLVLLDIKMPGLDGYETMKRLRTKDTPAARLPVIFLTANDGDESEATGLALGALDYIRKPFVPEVLQLRVNHMIELTNLQKSLHKEVHNS